MKKFKKIKNVLIFIALGSVLVASLLSINHLKNQSTLKSKKRNNDKHYNEFFQITVSGAIELPGTYYFEKDATLRTVLKKVGIMKQADWSKIDLSMHLKDKMNVEIPFKPDFKLPVSFFNTIEKFKILNIAPKQAKSLFNYFKENTYYQWEDIAKLDQIGEITIAKLREHLIL
ncbi:MAG0490 family ComEA-like DNA-binding protein [Mycoplasma sp. 3341]|uniref:MAG0490 family ComEA-like DNA-binding protein n=1 Tax=Mycoplasma sp. 3341 TaxID=3447506 RepID=UPI003F65AC01